MTPRLLTKAQAAEYVGYSLSRFGELVRDGKFSPPITGTARWDKKKLDLELDRLSGISTNERLSAYDRWKARENEGAA